MGKRKGIFQTSYAGIPRSASSLSASSRFYPCAVFLSVSEMIRYGEQAIKLLPQDPSERRYKRNRVKVQPWLLPKSVGVKVRLSHSDGYSI